MTYYAAALLIILVGTIVIVVLTRRYQKSTSIDNPYNGTRNLDDTGRDDVINELGRQRTLTTRLRVGLAELSKCSTKILVVDSDISTRVRYRSSFSHANLTADYAFFYESGYEDAKRNLDVVMFELMIIDPQLPDGNGFALIEEHVFNGQRVPCIVATNSATLSDTHRQKLLAASIYIAPKPIDFAALQIEIERRIRNKTS